MPVCIGMYCVQVGIMYILNCNTCKYRLNTYSNTVILAPFHTACKAGWIRALLGVNVTTWSSLGWKLPWSFPLTILSQCGLKILL